MASATRPTMILSRIKSLFSSLGRPNGAEDAVPPKFKKNTSAIAWEFHVASELARLATQRKADAQKAAVEAGVIFDHNEKPDAPGTERIVYDDPFVQVQVKVNRPTEAVDVKHFVVCLEASGVPAKTINDALRAATKLNKAAHSFRSILKGGPTEDTPAK